MTSQDLKHDNRLQTPWQLVKVACLILPEQQNEGGFPFWPQAMSEFAKEHALKPSPTGRVGSYSLALENLHFTATASIEDTQ